MRQEELNSILELHRKWLYGEEGGGLLMQEKRYYSVSYDERNYPEIRLLRNMAGGLIAYARWEVLKQLLYSFDGCIALDDQNVVPLVMDELEFKTKEELTCTALTRAERTCYPVEKFIEDSPLPVMVCSERGRTLHYDEYREMDYPPYCGCGAKVVSE